jgi:choline-glycine betaine transporter
MMLLAAIYAYPVAMMLYSGQWPPNSHCDPSHTPNMLMSVLYNVAIMALILTPFAVVITLGFGFLRLPRKAPVLYVLSGQIAVIIFLFIVDLGYVFGWLCD